MSLEYTLVSSENENTCEEKERYTSKNPFVSLLFFSIGSLCMLSCSAVHGSIEAVCLSKHYRDIAVYIAGASNTIKMFVDIIMMKSVQNFVGKVSQMLSKDQKEEFVRAIIDMIRLNFVVVTLISLVAVFQEDIFWSF
jgi:hypothetical protein